MAPLEILRVPDPRLKQEALRVEHFDGELRQFVGELEQTMRAGPGAVGIAAPQVGRCWRVAILDVSGKAKADSHGKLVLINPEITRWEGMAMGREGCLSVPDYTGNVIRAESVTVVAHDLCGEEHTYQMKGYEARAAQHEIDHLDGILFLDRLVSRRSDLFRRKVYAR